MGSYKLKYRISDGRILGATTSGSDMVANPGESIVTTIAGDIPNQIVPYCEWTGTTMVDRGKWFHLYVSSPTATCTGDGTATVAINVQKRKWDDSNMTDAGDNDYVEVTTSRGRLDALNANLVNGAATFILTSVPETVNTVVTAATTHGEIDSGSTEIQFVP